MDELDFKVCVNCWTFNHSKWIEDALNGFCQQETQFPFVCAIVDDCSTDGEQEVINKFLESQFNLHDEAVVKREETSDYRLTFAQHKTNMNCYFAVYFLKYNHYQIKKSKESYTDRWMALSDYVAICEGDDYWIHPEKLQRQVDFLESHSAHSACIHAHRRDLMNSGGIKSEDIYKYPCDIESIPVKDIICNKAMFCATSSWLYRAEMVKNFPDWAKRAPVGDKPLKLVLCSKGYIGYINTLMSVYRVGTPGSWTVRVLRSRESQLELRRGMNQIMKDFDKWTKGKYHKYVRADIIHYKYVCLRMDLSFLYKRIKLLFCKDRRYD